METKKCKYCQTEIDKNAKICPNCKKRVGGMSGCLKAVIIVVVILIIIFALVAACTSSAVDTVNDAIEETENSYKDINGKTSFALNETFENSYTKITMTEVNTNFTDYSEYFGPADGYKVILVKFEVENIGDDDEEYISSLSFNGYADGVAVDQYYYAGDNYKDLSATLGKGKKASGYVAYEVPENTESFTIEYNADFWQDGTVIEFVVQ